LRVCGGENRGLRINFPQTPNLFLISSLRNASRNGRRSLNETPTARPPGEGLPARWWAFISRPSARFSLGGLVAVGVILGVMLWGGFHWALELTNHEAFCISCHEMRDNNYVELQKTIHFKNRSGVRATCPDCHVPREWMHKVRAKILATTDLYHHFMGYVDTPEKFEAKRAELAQIVWASMKASDSRECRNCHSVESMDPHKQSQASQVMMLAMKSGATCIDCHKGIAHSLPKR
jgi:cytochrome c-type protein NapC